MALLTDEEKAIDPYDVLSLAPAATEKDVTRAFRKLSLKYHPDKNPGAEAEVKFRLIYVAHEMLKDPAKRKYIDGRLEQDRKLAARRAEMSAKRKAGVDDLVRREEEAKRARAAADVARKEKADEESVREAGRRLMEEAQRRRAAARAGGTPGGSSDANGGGAGAGSTPGTHATHATSNANSTTTPTPSSTVAPPTITPQDLTLVLTLPPTSDHTSLDTLRPLLESRYGAISDTFLRPGQKKPGKKAKGAKAVVEFAPGNWGGCWACWRDHQGEEGAGAKEIEIGVRAKWAANEPAWVAWANGVGAGTGREGSNTRPSKSATPDTTTPSSSTPNMSSTPFSSAPNFSSAPDFSTTFSSAPDFSADSRAAPATKASADAFESVTLLRMRQLERERLARRIREEEGE